MNAAVLIGRITRIAASASAAAAMFNSTSTDSDDADVGRLQGMSLHDTTSEIRITNFLA